MPRPIAREIDREHCFGCGARNEHGLRLRFLEIERGVVEAVFHAAPQFRGPPGVLHGGVQATLLDEVMCMALESQFGGSSPRVVTANLALRYRAAAPIGERIVARGRYERAEGRAHFIRGELRSETGTLYTSAEARWVHLED